MVRPHSFDDCMGPETREFLRLRSGDRRKPRIVKHQHTSTIETGRNYRGEQSPYWDWVHQQQDGRAGNSGEELWEPGQANPDRLSTDDRCVFVRESGLSVGDVTRKLSGQQKKVFELYVQEGRSEKDIAVILRIKVSTVRTYLERVRRKFSFIP